MISISHQCGGLVFTLFLLRGDLSLSSLTSSPFLCFKAGACYGAQASFELMISLPEPLSQELGFQACAVMST